MVNVLIHLQFYLSLMAHFPVTSRITRGCVLLVGSSVICCYFAIFIYDEQKHQLIWNDKLQTHWFTRTLKRPYAFSF